MFEKVNSTLKILRLENSFLKVLYVGNILQFLIIAILVIAIISLFPLKEKEPYLVYFSNAQTNFVTVKKADSTITEDETVRLGLVMSYVLNREIKNNIDDSKRHEKVRLQSSNKVWRNFVSIVNTKNSIYQKSSLTRSIDLHNVHIVPGTNIAQIDFSATIRNKQKKVVDSNFRAVLQFKFVDKKLKFKDIPNNFTTFKVMNYEVSKMR
ncbi:type IV secretion system protein [Malaciobacter marinus]|uniref:type IV secretion system protein n=1 Tax=Malaciobacter marinus TaxID=505249 RepID=UPI003AFF9CB1